MAYPSKFIERVVDHARDLLKEGYPCGKAIEKALDQNGFEKAKVRDRNEAIGIVKRKLAFRSKSKREANKKRRMMAEKNLSLPFPSPSSR